MSCLSCAAAQLTNSLLFLCIQAQRCDEASSGLSERTSIRHSLRFSGMRALASEEPDLETKKRNMALGVVHVLLPTPCAKAFDGWKTFLHDKGRNLYMVIFPSPPTHPTQDPHCYPFSESETGACQGLHYAGRLDKKKVRDCFETWNENFHQAKDHRFFDDVMHLPSLPATSLYATACLVLRRSRQRFRQAHHMPSRRVREQSPGFVIRRVHAARRSSRL